MKVKTFHALTMQDALRDIKEELGPDAIILSAKEVREGGRPLKAFNRPVLEVMAASDQDIQRFTQGGEKMQQASPEKPPDAGSDSAMSAQTFQQTLQGMLKPNGETIPPTVGKRPASLEPSMVHAKPNRLRPLRTVMNDLSRLLEDLSREDNRSIGNQPPMPGLLRRSLIEQGMNSSTVDFLLNEARKTAQAVGPSDDDSMRLALHREIAKRVRTSGQRLKGGGYPSIGLLIGPSGAGKTAAVAKLASHYRLERRRSVALITFDRSPEIAVEQLRRYAKVVGVPFACALSPRQVHEGLRRHTEVDIVLIDMPGIGPSDLALAKELRRLLPEEAVTTHLVLSASTREQELCRITRRLGDLPHLRLLFTKLDETESFGTIFEVTHQTGVPLSYWSIGRRVPGDLEVASSERLAAFLTGGHSVHSQVLVNRSVRSSEGTPALMGAETHHG